MSQILKELAEIRGDKSRISPEEVVEWARNHRDSAIYHSFDKRGLWRDKTAANIARLEHGRSLIRRYKVTITIPERKDVRVRAFVSLSSDRGEGQPSYQLRRPVLSDAEKFARLCDDCSRDIKILAKRWVDVLTDQEQEQLRIIAGAVLLRRPPLGDGELPLALAGD